MTMLLHCTLVRAPGAVCQEPPVELTVEGQYGASGTDLQAELAGSFRTGTVSVSGQELKTLALGEPPLVSGAVLVDCTPEEISLRPRQRTAGPPASVALAVHSGPGAGMIVPLRRGTYIIGRSQGEILIQDADLSRVHARLVVADTAISIVDLDSANGTEVNGERVRSAVVSTGSTIRCGKSAMSIVFLDNARRALDGAGVAVDEPVVVRRRDEPSNRAVLLVTAVLPLVIGVGLAVVTGMWMFLAFTAVSAVSILVPLVGGRRRRREFAQAVQTAVAQDQERRRRAAPPLSDITLGVAAGGVRMGRDVEARDGEGPAPGGVWLRLGLAAQPANLRYEPADPDRTVPAAGLLPLTLDPATPLTTIRGPRTSVQGLVRSLLIQLAGYPSARDTHVIVHGDRDRLPITARYLANVTLSSNAATLDSVLKRSSAPEHGVLFLLNDPPPGSSVIARALANRWQIIHQPGGNLPHSVDVELGESASFLHSATGSICFSPDLVPHDVFNQFCRRLAGLATGPGISQPAIPTSCTLEDLLPASAPETSSRWSANANRPGLAVPIGRALNAVRVLDLQADGPHLLVAGTTGSGKSELLRSLTLALALSYPPGRINFLFVDYKGGSGLGPLTGLPHCVGMLTDLSSHELERSLLSLRAEIKHREEALAAVQVPDLSSYRATSASLDAPLPHLVIVIDEFRMLVEEAPEALRELMRVASIGRSLGIHLVMATQRPQGALTADIRANVTTSIALRVQSDMESIDIINTKAAAGISVATPGRAYLARGTERPEEFQTGSLTAGANRTEPGGVSVRLASEYIHRKGTKTNNRDRGGEATPAEGIAPLVTSMAALWTALNGSPVRKPIAAPLPCVLPDPGCSKGQGPGSDVGQEWSIALGLLDLPSEQRTAPLTWDPAVHGHLALVGGPESGVPEAVRLVVRRLTSHQRESHLYILDSDSSFAGLASHCRVGSRTGLDELRRAVRILERLTQEQGRRLGRPAENGDTQLVLVITEWGSWVSALRAGPLAWAEDLVQDLVRDGGRAGITVLISGQRELVMSRFFPAIPNRVYFPTGSNEDGRIAWPKLPPTAQVVGRGVAQGALSGRSTAVCQFYAPADTESGSAGNREAPLRSRPFRVEPLPAVVPASRIPGESSTPADEGHRFLRIGLGGDELQPASLRLPAGGVLAALGGPASGKTSFLRLLPRLNPDSGPWLQRPADAEPAAYWSAALRRAGDGQLDRRTVVLVDDADLLPWDVNRDLAELTAYGLAVVLTAGFSPILPQRVPLTLHARNAGMGLLIAPRTLMDGDLFGVRFEAEPNPPPGRSVLIQNGRATSIQLGWIAPEEPPRRTSEPLGYRAGGKSPAREA